jgi:hypothetical protein
LTASANIEGFGPEAFAGAMARMIPRPAKSAGRVIFCARLDLGDWRKPMKKLLFLLSVLSILATVIPADAQSCPPGKRWYCSGSKCSCV